MPDFPSATINDFPSPFLSRRVEKAMREMKPEISDNRRVLKPSKLRESKRLFVL